MEDHGPGTVIKGKLAVAGSGGTRSCPDCGRPQHYTGIEYGWAHDALIDTWHCADPAKAGA